MTLTELKFFVEERMDNAFFELDAACEIIQKYVDDGGKLDNELSKLEDRILMALIKIEE